MAEPVRPPGGRRGIAGVMADVWPPRGALAGGWPAIGSGASSAFAARLKSWAAEEAGAGRLLPWVPVAFGVGIALYFTADHEPVLWIAATTAALLGIVAIMMRRHRLFPVAVMIVAAACGFAAATVKTARVAHPVLARPLYSVALSGFVEARDIRERSDRIVLRVTSMESPRNAVTIARVRLAVRKGAAPEVGSFVQLKARLLPPMAPVRPGSYDFARDMFFQGIGASGFVMGAITTATPPQAAGFGLGYAAAMQGLRDAIDARIRGRLSGDERAIATALLTGRRDAITPDVNDAMFVSGLGHVLSISGYHMAVVAGVVFFAVRALLALIPGLTISHPIKKWAAAAALVAAAFYLLLSGAEVATQRSFFMTAVVLIAVMVDRRAVTFRTLAVAAMIVLVAAPEALVHPSFQMSFAATLGLVALVQFGLPRLFATPDSSATQRIALWGGRELAMLLLASLIAGLATTPYAAFHFHRVTPYGVLANLAAMPVVSALVMPAGLMGLVAAPFGLDGPWWTLMGLGIDWMIAVTRWVAALPGAVGRIPAFGIGPLILASLGVILIGLLRTPLRWSGAVGLVVATVWAAATPLPDVLIAGDGRAVAVRGRDGRLHAMRIGKDVFATKEWLAADADARLPADSSLTDGVSCDEAGCVVAMADGRFAALTLRAEALADDCARAALIVTARAAPSSCAAAVIDRERLRQQGALMLVRQGRSFAVTPARAGGTDRPWWPAPAEAGEFDTTLTPRAPAVRPQDATPPETEQGEED
ncbi:MULTISPECIES: ComEC/Rec2 family competence protein [unclassified Bradyrhizobium]|uniref:ComEC/Rec2 family competence protein n=1 Tax=unclassified Bradyrhizobium TaxID=2631580 RepID=UPI0028ED7611|nr:MULTISPECIES: ComEC/Rec2 family competence protein [unclassified Bradyrhizobium]